MSGVRANHGAKQRLAGAVLCIVAAVAAAFFALVRDYGPGYDELIGDFQYGERSWFFLLTLDWHYLDLAHPGPEDLALDGHRDLEAGKLEAPYVHGHGAAVGSAAACWLLFRTLGVLPAVDAHHTVNLLFAVALIVVLFTQLHRLLGPAVAWLAVLCWLAQPRLVAHGFFNIKDFPEACLFGLTVLTFFAGWHAVQPTADDEGVRRKGAWLIASAALGGFALSVKVNAVFLPAVLLGWFGLLKLNGRTVFHRGDGKWAAILPLVAAASFFATWPYLWLYPSELWNHIQFVASRGFTGTLTLDPAALAEWLVATPEVVLVGLLLGFAFALREPLRARRDFLWLVMLWFAVPLVRASLPGMRHYDGMRHFLEATVPAAVLAAYGWGNLIRRAWSKHAALSAGVAGLVGAGLVWPFWGLHPFELAYFNRISGGLNGAVARGHPDAGDYWAASYRQGVRWLNSHAPRGAVVAVPFAEHLVQLTRGGEGLRWDLQLLSVLGPFELSESVDVRPYQQALRQGPVYVMFARANLRNAIMRHARRFGKMVYPHGKVDGVQVLSIYLVPAGSGPIEEL
jgi:hypothetical protein